MAQRVQVLVPCARWLCRDLSDYFIKKLTGCFGWQDVTESILWRSITSTINLRWGEWSWLMGTQVAAGNAVVNAYEGTVKIAANSKWICSDIYVHQHQSIHGKFLRWFKAWWLSLENDICNFLIPFGTALGEATPKCCIQTDRTERESQLEHSEHGCQQN